MAKPRCTSFTEEFEPIVVSAWDAYAVKLEGGLLKKTQEAIIEIRRKYRYKAKFPSRTLFKTKKYRAGYLAAFGQRHAYLSYWHLAQIRNIAPENIPSPQYGKITATIIGAGAGLEVYGLCLFYNEFRQEVKKLNENLIEKVDEWKPTRHILFSRLLKDKFPKINIIPKDIDVDIASNDCIKKFAEHHDTLVSTDILIIYNVMNEIAVDYAEIVYRNLLYILRQATKKLMIIVMEPSADKVKPRIKWLVERLAENTVILLNAEDELISFDKEPILIFKEGNETGLNDRLFGARGPSFENSLRRTHFASIKIPDTPISQELAYLQTLNVRRSHGRYISGKRGAQYKLPL